MSFSTRASPGTLALKASYLFFKAIGLIPARLRHLSPKKGRPTFVYSRGGTLRNSVLIVSFAVLSCFSVHAMNKADYPNKSPTTEAIEVFKAALGSILVLIVWTWVCVHQREAIKVANDFLAIDSVMRSYSNLYSPKTVTQRFVLVWVFNTLIWINMFWSDYMVFDHVPVIAFISSVGPNFIFNWFLLMYTFSIIYLRMKVQAVNDGILRLSADSVSRISASPGNFDDRFFMKAFFALKGTHMRLHEVISEMDKFYSFPILLVIAEMCASIVYTAYYLMVPIFLPSVKQAEIMIFNSVCYLSMEVFPITIMTISIGQIVQELGRTADAVHKCLSRVRLSRKAKAELRLFSLELLHQNVQFTACGIFALDGTLLHSICGMTATYLIILIQFQPTARPSEENPNLQ
ncbi:uncharacterized protein LOC114841435 [Diachasma alloeum]|uniref:Gustatory receptor n=1 Tax=Diachasma alloeum TaxID=454923 RepID=A0A4E0RZ37_9HYME|nr:uncharacterized protein LOC114841435 [Diachasma alloeum]THK33151.1 gustatory receptor 18 [Diachasma alloeum]